MSFLNRKRWTLVALGTALIGLSGCASNWREGYQYKAHNSFPELTLIATSDEGIYRVEPQPPLSQNFIEIRKPNVKYIYDDDGNLIDVREVGPSYVTRTLVARKDGTWFDPYQLDSDFAEQAEYASNRAFSAYATTNRDKRLRDGNDTNPIPKEWRHKGFSKSVNAFPDLYYVSTEDREVYRIYPEPAAGTAYVIVRHAQPTLKFDEAGKVIGFENNPKQAHRSVHISLGNGLWTSGPKYKDQISQILKDDDKRRKTP